MMSLIGRDNRRIGGEREVNTRETSTDGQIKAMLVIFSNLRNQVCLELVQIHVQRTIEPKGRCDRRHDLSNKSVQICKTWGADAKILLANIVNGFIVDLKDIQ